MRPIDPDLNPDLNPEINPEINPENNQKNNSNNQKSFAYLSQQAQVISRSSTLKSLSLIVFFSLLFLLVLFLAFQKQKSNSHPKPAIQISGEVQSSEDQYLLQGNLNKNANLNSHSPSSSNTKLDSGVQSLGQIYQALNSNRFNQNQFNSEPGHSAVFSLRENSPTGVYQDQNSNQNLSKNNAENNSVLAGSGNFSDYANSQKQDFETIRSRQIQHPDLTIAEGELIKGSLETAINSDLPGMIEAVLSQPVYSYLGADLLIPMGSRLIGQYTSMSSNGAASDRIFVVWNRLITPDGRSIMINSPGSDQLGQAGMGADSVNTHFWKIFGTSALLSILGAGVSNMGVSPSDQANSADAYRQAVSGSLVNSSSQALNQNQNINPTLHFYQGDPITIFVAHDLDLA